MKKYFMFCLFILSFSCVRIQTHKQLLDKILADKVNLDSLVKVIPEGDRITLIGELINELAFTDNGLACEWYRILDEKERELFGINGSPADLFDDKPAKKLLILYFVDILFWADMDIYTSISILKFDCNPYDSKFVLDSCSPQSLNYYIKSENAKRYPYQDCERSTELEDYTLNKELFKELKNIYSQWYKQLKKTSYKTMLTKGQCPLHGTKYRWKDKIIDNWAKQRPIPFLQIKRGADFLKRLEENVQQDK